MPGLVGEPTLASLRNEALRKDTDGELGVAHVGNGAGRAGVAVRGDRTAWLEETSASVAENVFRALIEELRLAINGSLLLGLWRYDGHYAIYATGASYALHKDRFADDDLRVVSCVLYLNDDWRAPEGGALRLHLGDETRDVLPIGGTMVAFLSDAFPHEVLAATRPRIALTGWFKRRA
jgi:SM-20-related protein